MIIHSDAKNVNDGYFHLFDVRGRLSLGIGGASQGLGGSRNIKAFPTAKLG